MSIKSRLDRLEAKDKGGAPVTYRLYFYDEKDGYSVNWNGPFFATYEELARAQGWETGKADRVIKVTYTDDNSADD